MIRSPLHVARVEYLAAAPSGGSTGTAGSFGCGLLDSSLSLSSSTEDSIHVGDFFFEAIHSELLRNAQLKTPTWETVCCRLGDSAL